ncbi:hypothetical protein ATANTOWER_031473 [Ataeniobius toweri]|uniref:Uncharacterized protein n=1 Tax=Ataeniobius toweri TaxID=208326 RepID=A0ABU7C142_9TELE|nr:hypothetical protein [Ataeniobius toweri]
MYKRAVYMDQTSSPTRAATGRNGPNPPTNSDPNPTSPPPPMNPNMNFPTAPQMQMPVTLHPRRGHNPPNTHAAALPCHPLASRAAHLQALPTIQCQHPQPASL